MEEEGRNQRGDEVRDNWKMGVDAERRKSLMNAFEKKDADNSGYLDSQEIKSALKGGGVVASEEVRNLRGAKRRQGFRSLRSEATS